ncbi:MAG TPA: DUF2239 family protein [Gemmatimonadaceae bacterium]|jgi:hypothetical protein|nr:DUF2239 family protein [Gemmatimonadaceae bacterium]
MADQNGEEIMYTAFAGNRRIAAGNRDSILSELKQYTDSHDDRVLIFEDMTGKQVDFDFSGSLDDVLERGRARVVRVRPGRPKLGVVGREVSLLPRHWDWLEDQPNGISAALRRLVDEARKREPGAQRAKRLRDGIARFMWAMGGDLPHFEDATRALYGESDERLEDLIAAWPADVRAHIVRLVEEVHRLEQL